MNTYKYRPYYQYNGPSASNPLREMLTDDEQERSISLFYTDVLSRFEDDYAVISRDAEGVLSIQTLLPKQECDDRIAQLLTALDLYGIKL
ncbi:hypothetical protein AUC60_11770 [Pseudomonas caspiana]|uniref:Uncharacterized protein n=1 Tax=Pseudomonas caspiana TaxID=1451454 RepID=A0A1Y3P4V2_9PSED|nr:hypothetical protein AUC60_11770 [Pseudomonas caspiana]